MEIPDEILQKIQGYDVRDMPRWSAPSAVSELRSPGRPTLILKVGPDLAPEERRLRWLAGLLPVPTVLAAASRDDTDYLLMTKIPGADGSDERLLRKDSRFVELVADALRTVHSVPVADCPFDASVERLLEVAERRVSQGVLRAHHFPSRYLGRSPRELLDILKQLRPSDEAAVFTHGDPSLVNILFHRDRVSGIIDLGLAGISDPYRDLGIAARSLTLNMGGRWVRPFLQAYGASPDHLRLEFFALLDEFVMARPA